MNRKSFQVITFLIVALSISVAKTDVFADKNKKRRELDKGLSRLPTAEQLKQNRQERLLHQKLEALSERPRQAGQAKFERDRVEEAKVNSRPKSLESENFKVRRQIQRYSKWQRFAQPGKLSKNWDGSAKRSAGIQPSVLINGASSDTIDAGESFTFSITFTSGKDSALVDLFYDADGDGNVGDGDISLFNLSFGGRGDGNDPAGSAGSGGAGSGGHGTPFWVYDNSGEDENLTDGIFVATFTDLPFMGISTIFQVTDGGGTGEAVLTINNLTGDYTASGTVSPLTGPGLVTFEYWTTDGYRTFMTFTDSNGKFEFGTFDLDRYSNMWATDAALGIETGSYLEHERWFDNPGDLEEITFDITRDAEASGTVLNTEDGSGIEGVWIEAGLWKGNESLFSYTMSNADGEFSLPLQGGNLYNRIFVDHPNYKSNWDGCLDYPFYVQSGDKMEVECELTTWPAFIEGQVTDSKTGNPLPDVEVDISVAGTASGEYSWNMAWTDYDGYYRLGSIYGEGSLWAYDWEHREHQNAEIDSFVVDAPLVTQNIEMVPYDGAISGTITDSETGNPISVAWVNARTEDYEYYGWGQSDGDGNYTISVMNGTYQVCADKWSESYFTNCVEDVTVSNNTVTADITLDPPDGFISGYVENADTDEPIAGISLQASGDHWFNIQTDENGFFQMGVKNGTYKVCLYDWTNTYQTDNICFHNITVSDDTYTLATIYLSPGSWDGAIVGSVTNQYGDAVMASIQAVDTLNWDYRYTYTDDKGKYLLPIDNGEYVVKEYPYQYGYLMNVEMGVEVNSDTVTVDFLSQVIERDAVLKGTVTDGSSNPMENVWININAMGGRFEWGPDFWGETDADGHYEIDVMGFDDRYYWVYANYYNNETSESWTSGQDSVSIQPIDTVEVNLQLGAIVYSSNISGFVTMEGEPLEYVSVNANNTQLESYFSEDTDEEGFYSMKVPNGDYSVCVDQWDSDQGEFFNLLNLECRDISVWDDSATVDFDIGPPGIFVPNLHGNFRFTWNSHGEMTNWNWRDTTSHDPNGEWPANSGVNYLYEGGLFVMGYHGNDLLLGGEAGEGWMGGDGCQECWIPASWGITVRAEDDFEFVSRYMVDESTGLSAKEIIATKDGEDMVLIGTRLRNDDPDSLKLVRAGYALDWDVAYSENNDNAWRGDLSGSVSFDLLDPINANAIPVKVSYIYDKNGDNGSSPGYVGSATIFETGTGAGAGTHLSFLFKDVLVEDEEFVKLLESDTDSPDETDTGDYVLIQMSEPINLGPGDEMNFITVLLAAESLEGFQSMLQSALTYVMLAGLGEFSAAVDEPVILPEEYALHQNHPNPFNPVTTIRYDLPQATDVTLIIYDMLGREIKVLVSKNMSPGSHTAVWDGTDRLGQPAAAGVYIYQLKSGDFTNTKKLVLLK